MVHTLYIVLSSIILTVIMWVHFGIFNSYNTKSLGVASVQQKAKLKPSNSFQWNYALCKPLEVTNGSLIITLLYAKQDEKYPPTCTKYPIIFIATWHFFIHFKTTYAVPDGFFCIFDILLSMSVKAFLSCNTPKCTKKLV
jgi:hypothetical protein